MATPVYTRPAKAQTVAAVVRDLVVRADMLDASAADMSLKHTKQNRLALQLCARVLRMAASDHS